LVHADEIAIEMIIALDELGIEKVTELANIMYESGNIPDDLCKSIFIALPKKSDTIECEPHRTIGLMSRVTKLILRVLLARARRKIREHIAEEQYGFMPDKGTRNPIFILRILSEGRYKCRKIFSFALLITKRPSTM